MRLADVAVVADAVSEKYLTVIRRRKNPAATPPVIHTYEERQGVRM